MPKSSSKRKNNSRKNVDFDSYRNRLKLKDIDVTRSFNKKHPSVNKFLEEKGVDLKLIRTHSAKLMGTGVLTGALLFSPPSGVKPLPVPNEIAQRIKIKGGKIDIQGVQKVFMDGLNDILPKKPRPLSGSEEKALEQLFSEFTGVKVKANLEGEHLNTTYGYIGAEQHLRRYPGDTLAQHEENLNAGIAPGLGAWGYFASRKDKLTNSLKETEKWYAVVQTLYLPDWNKRQPYLKNWYKYRKVLVVNTKNGNAVVASIADSGPAAWTGKQFGGSPEVMEYLGGPRYRKGAVVLFFVDDPENKVPLGPVEYDKIKLLGSIFERS